MVWWTAHQSSLYREHTVRSEILRIVVVGATGNTGTAVLEELRSRSEVSSVLGIARRLPDRREEPYASTEWQSIDIQFDQSQDTLVSAFSGADAVIHLAWLIQPNSQRDLLRRVNVEGTRRVLQAAASAGVGSIVVASSVGAYSPVDDDALRSEEWAVRGIPGSHYSMDKAAQEQVMDEFEADHPDIALARLRPGLIFQSSAGSEIQRLFLGMWAPVQLIGVSRIPALPLPKGLRVQAVHSADVAVAYVEAALRRAHGAFNICADDVLDAHRLASVITGRRRRPRPIPLPAMPLRWIMRAAHRTRILPADEGWLDMAMRVPLMDTSKARRELDWRPRRSAYEALAELLDGMTEGSGTASVPMRPRSSGAPRQEQLPPHGHQLPDSADRHLMKQYLGDHLTGATAGMKRIEAMASAYADTEHFAEFGSIADAIRKEHRYIQELMKRLGFSRPAVPVTASWIAERAARLKPFGRPPANRSPSALVLEVELMGSAVTGKLHGWWVMREHAQELGVPEAVFEQLITDAEGQRRMLEDIHAHARRSAFRTE